MTAIEGRLPLGGTASPFVRSNYARRPDDAYPTVDGRCVEGLLDTWTIEGIVVDCCAPNGSGLVDAMNREAVQGFCEPTVHFRRKAAWICTNPPYRRKLVDEIATAAVERVRRREVLGAAFLMRANWDLSACRAGLFASNLYRGQTRMQFRPWWSDERKAQPVHCFVWHIWAEGLGEPVIRYWQPAKRKRGRCA